jgi:2-polyprenyl-3-methyl-5-hydroxy-6-metoxy-1,4-benzoquinol methylase
VPGFGFATRLPSAIRPLLRRTRNLALGIRSLRCPAELQMHHRPLTAIGEQRIRNALRQHFSSYGEIVPDVEMFLATQEGERDLSEHLLGRLSNNRYNVIPWVVDSTGSLKGSKVLEIGCGTGAATVALVEQGALVTATDFNEASLHTARERLAAYGLSANVSCASAADALRDHKNEQFDLIAFFAVLEHMTLDQCPARGVE